MYIRQLCFDHSNKPIRAKCFSPEWALNRQGNSYWNEKAVYTLNIKVCKLILVDSENKYNMSTLKTSYDI